MSPGLIFPLSGVGDEPSFEDMMNQHSQARMAYLHRKRGSLNMTILDSLVDRRALMDIQGMLRKAGDTQSVDLLNSIQKHILKGIKVPSGWEGGINRLADLARRGASWDPALVRNNVFKVAHALGMKLPSMMFASEIRLAELRLRLSHRHNVRDIDPEVAMQMADEIRALTGQKAHALQQEIRGDIRDLRNQDKDLDRAWSKWDWRGLKELGLVSKDDFEFVTEVLARYSW